jgi:signal transduction histidine kinase
VRKRILGVAMLAVALAVVLFGLPLSYVIYQLAFNDEHRELDRSALRGALAASATLADSGAVVLPPEPDRQIHRGIYDRTGRRIAGEGPEGDDPAVAAALTGVVDDRTVDGDLVVAVPVYNGNEVIGAARAAATRSHLYVQILAGFGGMAALAVVAGGSSYALSARQARRIAAPLVELERVTEELGDGNFAVRANPSGVAEIDRAGAALNRTAQRLDDLLARERAFNATASHQLRTPLTVMRLGLEQAAASADPALRKEIAASIAEADRLSATIDDVLTLARGAGSARTPLDLAAVLEWTRSRWQRPLAEDGRALVIEVDDPPPATASASAVRQILDVLVDNARRHGTGTVRVVARSASGAPAIDVMDEGHVVRPLVPDLTSGPPAGADGPAPRRLGLWIAASLASAEEGRLVHARTDPTTRLTLLLPAEQTETTPA